MTPAVSRSVRAAAFGLLGLAACQGPEVARLEIGELGQTATKEVALRPAQELEFGFVSGPYEYDGNDHVILEVTLLKGSSVVGQAHWTALPLQGYFGSHPKKRGTKYHSEWKMTVPAEGATAIRATARLDAGTSKARFGQIAVVVHTR